VAENQRNGLVLFSFQKHPKRYYETLFGRLSERAPGYGLNLYKGALKDIRVYIGPEDFRVQESSNDMDVADFDVVYFELWSKCPQQALATSTYLDVCHVPYLGPNVRRIQPDTKLGELSLLKKAGLPIPETASSSHKQLRKWFRESAPIDFPVVAKNISGYGGKINFKAHSQEELFQVFDEHPEVTFVVQEYIPSDRDYRFLVMDGAIQLVLQRQGNDDTHLNNTSRGAQAHLVDPGAFSQKVVDMVLNGAAAVGRREFAGVDLMFDMHTGQPYVLEVNKTPQIEIGSSAEEKMSALLSYLNRLSRKENA
jgi:glutathione synthase/RimK-type ligase-like ATP-grasp enzyme